MLDKDPKMLLRCFQDDAYASEASPKRWMGIWEVFWVLLSKRFLLVSLKRGGQAYSRLLTAFWQHLVGVLDVAGPSLEAIQFLGAQICGAATAWLVAPGGNCD